MRRSRAWLAVFAALLLPVAAHAGVAFGVRGGLSFSGHTWESDVLKPESKFGPGGGAFFTFGEGGLLSFQPEVLYVTKGSSWGESEATDDAGNPTGTFKLLHVVDYVEIPVLVRLTVPLGGAIHPVLSAGPAIAFEAAEKLQTIGDFESTEEVDLLRNTDFGVALGLGFELIGGGGIWSLDGRWTQGLRNIQRDDSALPDNRNWNVLVTIGFARAID